MIKTNLTQKLSTLLVAAAMVCFSSGLQAQTIMWGAGSSNPAIDSMGRLASTDGTVTGAGWSSAGTSTTGVCPWVWSADGVSQGFAGPGWVGGGTGQWISDPTNGSPTNADGCALFDSDFYDSGGTGVGAGTAVAPQNADLLSPIIDLSGFEDSVCAVKFWVSYLDFGMNDLSVGLSTDGGSNWTSVDYRGLTGGSGVRAWYNGWASVTLNGVLDGAAPGTLNNCRLRFSFEGDYYFVAVDDISIVVGPNYDLTFAASSEDYANLTIGYPAPYKRMPLDQVDGSVFTYGALVQNTGGKAIPLSANPTVHYDISEETAPGVWSSVYTTSWPLTADIAGGDTASVSGDITAMVDATAGVLDATGYYRATYWVAHDLTDSDNSNDTMSVDFWITDNWYSAAPRDMAAMGPEADGFSFPGVGNAANVVQEFEWGGLYYFPTGGTATKYIDSVYYREYVSTSHNPALAPEVEVTINVYEWVDGNADNQVDFETELQIRTLTKDTVPVSAGDLGTHLSRAVKIVDPVDHNSNGIFDENYPLVDDMLIAVTSSQKNVDGLIDLAGDRYGFFVSTYDAAYEWNQEFTIEGYTPLRVVEGAPGAAGTESWYSGFSGPHSAPAMSLLLADSQYSNVAVEDIADVTAESVNVALFPNPTSGLTTVKVELEKEVDAITYILTDISGRVLNMETRNNLQNDTYTIDATNLPSGVYFVNVKTELGITAKRFVKK